MSDTTSDTPPCEALPWDSEFFGLAVARVRGGALGEESCPRIDAWCAREKTSLLYFLADGSDAATSRLAGWHGFELVDVRMTLGCPVAGAAPATVSEYTADDLPALLRIAAGAYTDSRFYFDGRLPREKCDRLYQRWTELSCQGMAQGVLVARRQEQVAGYVTCVIDAGRKIGSIGLLGVDKAHQRQGVGRALVAGALEFFAGRQCAAARVVTQGRNVAAQRLYQRCGFVTETVQLYYHKWYGVGG